MHNGSAAFSRLVRQLVCANPINYVMSMEPPHYSNFSKTHVITKTDRELSEDGLMIQKESNDNL